jgi:Flp pilus assembly protein TadB
VKIEKDEDTYSKLKEMALDIHLVSRNYNNEIIGIEYYRNFDVLTDSELKELEYLWHQKVNTCLKEKLASNWMIIQILIISVINIYIAWLSHPYAGIAAFVVLLIFVLKIADEKRIKKAKRNLSDARLVHDKLIIHMDKRALR